MDFSGHRRVGGAKYGKSRKVLGYNFFDTGRKVMPVAPAAGRLPISPSSPGTVDLDKDELAVPPDSPSRSPVRPAHITSHSRASLSHSNDSRSESPSKQSSETPGTADTSMFDLDSSGDEHDGGTQPPAKRRKLVQPLKQKQLVTREVTQADPVVQKPKRKVLAKKEENVAVPALKGGAKPQATTIATSHQEPTKTAAHTSTNSGTRNEPKVQTVKTVATKYPGSKLADKPQPAKVVSKTKLKKVTYGRKQPTAPSPRVRPAQDEDTLMEDAEMPTNFAQDTIPTSKAARLSTPKKQQQRTIDRHTTTTSPSQLALTDLRLTPEKRARSLSSSISTSPAPRVSDRQRGRTRRIDLLDAPEDEDSHTSTRHASVEALSLVPPPGLKSEVATETAASPHPPPGLSRSGSSQTRQTYGRARNTYGRERSHLANMVDDLNALSHESSQEAILSQLTSQSGPSQLQMELDLEDASSDDAIGATKLKSIHELRQAGTNNRFERDLETMLEDIDPTQVTASKSLRLQGLMKLFRKMANNGFANFTSDRALDRLALWSRSVTDKLSKLLFDMILWRLIHAKNMTPTKLRTVLQAVASSTALITNLDTMTQIARDRKKENLSKALVGDIIDFEATALANQNLPNYEGDNIVPAAVTIAALHDSLRALVEAGVTNISVGGEACRSIAVMLEKASRPTNDGSIQHKFLAKLALSLLKLFAGPLDSDLGLPDDAYLSLGNTLASIIDNSLGKDEDLVQSVYHFAISLCNDRPHICQQIALSQLSTSAMKIIDTRFLMLVDVAEAGNEIDTVMLDSIILSLACLLNMTEHENEERQVFARSHMSTSESNSLERLIAIYIQAAPRLCGATTAEQSQMLVSFGYLSLLICNLCLNEGLWVKTSRLLGQYSMSDVVASAKELLIHLQTLDMAQVETDISGIIEGGDMPVDGITQRFGRILAAVRVE